jgi:hypothetical protein
MRDFTAQFEQGDRPVTVLKKKLRDGVYDRHVLKNFIQEMMHLGTEKSKEQGCEQVTCHKTGEQQLLRQRPGLF